MCSIRFNLSRSPTIIYTLCAEICGNIASLVAFIELRDRYKHPEQYAMSQKTPTSDVTQNEAQLAAMLENAKNSTWRDNLRNASDAQQRFMLPGRDIDEGKGAPEYLNRINKRSKEILKDVNEKRKKEREDENDPSKTRFWR